MALKTEVKRRQLVVRAGPEVKVVESDSKTMETEICLTEDRWQADLSML